MRLPAHLLEEWAQGSDSFGKDPPNATVSVLSKDGIDRKGCRRCTDLSETRWRQSHLRAVKKLEGDLAGADGPAAVFIDIIGMPVYAAVVCWRCPADGSPRGVLFGRRCRRILSIRLPTTRMALLAAITPIHHAISASRTLRLLRTATWSCRNSLVRRRPSWSRRGHSGEAGPCTNSSPKSPGMPSARARHSAMPWRSPSRVSSHTTTCSRAIRCRAGSVAVPVPYPAPGPAQPLSRRFRARNAARTRTVAGERRRCAGRCPRRRHRPRPPRPHRSCRNPGPCRCRARPLCPPPC